MKFQMFLQVFLMLLVSILSQAQTTIEVQTRRVWEMDGLRFDNLFSGARVGDVRGLGESRFLVISRPEFRPINPSPWYAFEMVAETPMEIEVVLMMDAANDFNRALPPLLPSRPWICHDDGVTWERLAEDRWVLEAFTGIARLQLPAGRTRMAAFRPYTLDQVMNWCDEWQSLPFVKHSVIGYSAEGRPIRQLTIAETEAPRFLILMGGQHPPEGDGDRGLAWFVDEFRADSPLARKFRQHFQTLVIPMLNPDGKHHGHWRGTLGGKDPNRDWTDQTLPEIRAAVRFLSETCLVDGGKVAAFVDFHATNRDFFFVSSNDLPEDQSSFVSMWFANIEKEQGGFRPDAVPSPNQAAGVSSGWARRVLNCPAYTREFAYNQDEQVIRLKCRDEARALMRTLLQNPEVMD